MKNYGSQYNHKVTLRLNEQQFDFITQVSQVLGVSPSEYIRMTINAGMVAMASGEVSSELNEVKEKVGMSNENIKTDKHSIV